MITTQVDQKGAIDLHEADAMLRMVYASWKADPLLLKQIDINGDGEVSMEELQQTVEEDNSVLAPAFQLQRMLRQRILGVRYWEQETLRRQTYFAGYDSGTTTSWDAIRDILAIKHRERLEEEERQRALRADSYTRCLRGCDLASQTATWPDKAQFERCFNQKCLRLKPPPETPSEQGKFPQILRMAALVWQNASYEAGIPRLSAHVNYITNVLNLLWPRDGSLYAHDVSIV